MSERRNLASLFLVSLFGLSFETFLSRYFALALFSDYSYWVISLALLGYSFGGVFLTLLRDHFYRHRATWLFVIPPLLLAGSIIAFLMLRANPFNPLQLQNQVLWAGQIKYIFLYYAGLFPVFFFTGVFIGLNFLIFSREIPRVYAVDLLGAAVGSGFILAAMFLVHPYHIPAVMLPLIFAVVILNMVSPRREISRPLVAGSLAASVALVGVGMYLILSVNPLSVPDFKKLHAILNIKGSRVVETRVSPAGSWLTVDDYAEFDDVSMTNNYGAVATASPPRTWGLYRDAQRVAPLARDVPSDFSYLSGSLSYFPYTIRPKPVVLLIGTNGGMKIMESARSGAVSGVAMEQPGDIYRIVHDRMAAIDPGFETAWGIRLERGTPFSLLRDARQRYDIIDVAGDFLSQDGNNSWSFTREAMEMYLRSLRPGGILSIPVDISEFDVYALKMVNTAVAALRRFGVSDPSRNILAYRSAWTCQILVSDRPFSRADIDRMVAWCSDRSFDTPWYPGMDPQSIQVWNDLPAVSFQEGQVEVSDRAQDALMTDLGLVFAHGADAPSASRFFNLAPSTMDRPDFSSISRLARLRTLVARLQVLPEKEIGYLLNVVILAEALLLALVVLFLPMAARRSSMQRSTARGLLPRVFLYFSALGFGFFFIELALIDKLSFFLESETLSFGVMLAGHARVLGAGELARGAFRHEPPTGSPGRARGDRREPCVFPLRSRSADAGVHWSAPCPQVRHCGRDHRPDLVCAGKALRPGHLVPRGLFRFACPVGMGDQWSILGGCNAHSEDAVGLHGMERRPGGGAPALPVHRPQLPGQTDPGAQSADTSRIILVLSAPKSSCAG